MKKLQKGKVLEELVKGSLDYTMQLIRDAFRAQFPDPEGMMGFYVNETFADHVIVSAWGSSNTLKTDEYWKVTYSKSSDSYVFAARDAWEVVELAYQAQSVISHQSSVGEGRKEIIEKRKGKFEERIEPSHVQLLEAKDEKKGTRRIRINDLMVADVENGNKRIYPSDVIEAMVDDWRPYLRESRGQGRLV